MGVYVCVCVHGSVRVCVCACVHKCGRMRVYEDNFVELPDPSEKHVVSRKV